MIGAGYSWNVILRVKNNTENLIDEVKFFYDNNLNCISVKKIKSSENKQTGVSTLYDVYNLRMQVSGIDNTYVIKDFIKKGNFNTITININSLNNNGCIFDVMEV